jgi:hypothetical protein
MSEYLSRHKKRPKSRSEELARYAKAEESLARKIGELPRSQTVFERIKQRIIPKSPQEQDKK